MLLTAIQNLNHTFKNYIDLLGLLSKRRKLQIFLLFISSILSALCETANIGILIPFLKILEDIDNNIYKLRVFGDLFRYLPRNLLLPVLGFCFISLIIISSSIRTLTIRNQLRLGSLISADLGKFSYKSILNKPYIWHVQSNSSNIISLLSQDVDRGGSIIKGLLSLCVNATLILIVGIFLFLISPLIMISSYFDYSFLRSNILFFSQGISQDWYRTNV